MNIDEYVEFAQRTSAIKDSNLMEKLEHAQIGLTTEVGEFADPIKKAKFYNKPIDKVLLEEEIGDIFWYLAEACAALRVKPSEILAKNIAKLKVRYPNKYNDFNAENRNLEKEREVLEGKDFISPDIVGEKVKDCRICQTYQYINFKITPNFSYYVECSKCKASSPAGINQSVALQNWNAANTK